VGFPVRHKRVLVNAKNYEWHQKSSHFVKHLPLVATVDLPTFVKTLHRFPWGRRSSLLPYRKRLENPEIFLATLTTQDSLSAFPYGQRGQGMAAKRRKVLYISANPFWSGLLCQIRQCMRRLKRGVFMHEVKVYDISGKLKRVISVQELNIRSQEQMDSPFLFRKNKRVRTPVTLSPKRPAKTGI
jgi:hypothetical protein